MATKTYHCEWCDSNITVKGKHPPQLFVAHKTKCKREAERERLRNHHQRRKQQHKKWGGMSSAARKTNASQAELPQPSDGDSTSPPPLDQRVASVLTRTRATMDQASLKKGFGRLLMRHTQNNPSFPTPPPPTEPQELSTTILDAFEEEDEEFVSSVSEATEKNEVEEPRSASPQIEPSPTSRLAPEPNVAPPPTQLEAADPIEEKAQRMLQPGGFRFTDRASIMQNLSDFGEVRKHFLLVDKFDALADLYDCFFLSYVEAYGGYGMDDHKKKVFLKENARIQRTFEHLKGETRPGKENADLRRYIETNLFRRLRTMIGAASMDTLSQREADKHERLLKLAEAMIATEEESGELRNLLDSLKQTKTEEKS